MSSVIIGGAAAAGFIIATLLTVVVILILVLRSRSGTHSAKTRHETNMCIEQWRKNEKEEKEAQKLYPTTILHFYTHRHRNTLYL